MEMSSSGSKHARDGEEEQEAESRPPKRFLQGLSPRAEELINILEEEEDADCGEQNGEEFVAAEEILCGVMKSLEEEISSSSRGGEEIRSRDLYDMDEMSYLLNASDDELGIPPSPSVYEDAYAAVAESQELKDSEHACNVEGLWQLEDQLAANSFSNWLMLLQLQAPEFYDCAFDENPEKEISGTNGSLFDAFSEGGEQYPMSCRNIERNNERNNNRHVM